MESAATENVDSRQTPSDTRTISPDEQERFVSILNLWHKIEFFIPFDLDQRIAEADEHRVRGLYRADLDRRASIVWPVEVEEDEEIKSFRLYLGVFERSEITKVCNRILGPSRDTDGDEEFERTDLDGRTCFAQLTLDAEGELDLESATKSSPVSSVSTLPWALGQFQQSGLESLTYERFENSKQDLAGLLLNFQASRKELSRKTFDESAGALTHSDVLELNEILQRWAGFSSSAEANLIGILEAKTGKKKQDPPAARPDLEEEFDPFKEEPELRIAILNSFFIQDIETAIKSIKSGKISASLKAYLSPLPVADRVDLESSSGLRAIVDALHPTRLKPGRWLSNADRSMTLMQQFAVNTILQDAADAPPLFSVNGPPGTGKTTFLQDIFADLIVCRARVLASLSEPQDAFLRKKSVRFTGGKSWRTSTLIPELTGFEMVVASSNNAAVENISGDLPKLSKLGSSWLGAEYLKPVAYKIAAEQKNGSFKKLSNSEEPWGLISCALGNSTNRNRFKDRFLYTKEAKNQAAFWGSSDCPQSITAWIDNYQGLDFSSAKEQFLKKDQEVAGASARLNSLADLLSDRLNSVHERRLSTVSLQVDECLTEKSKCQINGQNLTAAIAQRQISLERLKEDERLLNLSGPGWWAKLRRTPEAKRHNAAVRQNASAQLAIRQELSKLQLEHDAAWLPKFDSLSNKLESLEAELQQAEADKEAGDHLFQTERAQFASLPLPESLDALQGDEFQKSGLWRQDAIAQQRSELFAAALSVHEAWLACVGKPSGGFRPNIFALRDLLSGSRLEKPADALTIWRSLFMMVPIVSTTFASFHNQFRDLGPASLGWLFIDEAGQAVPQAAVGAIWRAKRAVVIGDPLQIEPVFTLPKRFISAVAELSPHTSDGSYSPDQTSVQKLADNANRFGVYLGNEDAKREWVGSPLRVHRRCLDPMFSWSNEIAYDGKMVFGLPGRFEPNGLPIPCESTWIDVKGNVSKRQEVPEQTAFILELLLALYQRDQQLPSLYLISPFKAIKTELTKRIREIDWKSNRPDIQGPKKSELNNWCNVSVGTVHTFQGKEEHSVLMILGADSQHVRSIDWACSKPNILNVALTRARRRFYLVGDRDLWGVQKPFAWSVGRLPTISGDQFLTIAQRKCELAKSTAS